MELSKNFDHLQAEQKWFSHWQQKGYFNSKPDDREAYTVVIPPPNVTGVLHMGHCLNNTIQDILIRSARQQGKNACWVPGTDHASIATEAKVVQMLRERGITKSSLSRDEFLGYAWEWKEKYGGIILEQLKKLGCSLDWNRVNFTMDEGYSQSVIKVFVDLYNKGMIYRGKRMINWDAAAKTALSDEEVIMRETQSKLYYLNYKLVNAEGEPTGQTITIATVRPETILGDTAIAINPNDSRFAHLHGGFALVPLINRQIPIITDEYVDMEFGTGALKVTPAHDKNDDMLGQKHNLQVIDIMNDDGSFSEAAQLFVGLDRFEVRKQIVPQLQAEGYLEKTEDYTNQVGYSERSNAVVEPRLSMQWWVKMQPLAEPALKVVLEDEIHFYPAKYKNLYQHWMGNIKDWCISRQLWWGHRIPAWYDANGNYFVAETLSGARLLAAKKIVEDRQKLHDEFTHTHHESELSHSYAEETIRQLAARIELKQDEDCLDTWFSSWLWPFEVFDGFKNKENPEINYYYPTATLVTAPEIIFFWVARMIMAGLEYKKQIPFKNVYFTGIVRDKQGRKMSKSLGNSPDLLELINVYGADAVRFGILIASPAGNDILFDESSIEQGKHFNNKLWNALKLVKMWEARVASDSTVIELNQTNFAIDWFTNRLSEVQQEINSLMVQFKLSEALKTIYSLIWDDFCSWYIEWIKPGFEQPIAQSSYVKTVNFFSVLMQMLHPFMPVITEEIYHELAPVATDICVQPLQKMPIVQTDILAKGELLKKVITALREARVRNQIKPKDVVQLYLESSQAELYTDIDKIICKQVNAEKISITQQAVIETIVVAVEKDKFFIKSSQTIDTDSIKETLLKDLEYQKMFLSTVLKKLDNERFVQNAKPEIVAVEEKKRSDAEARINAIQESLTALG